MIPAMRPIAALLACTLLAGCASTGKALAPSPADPWERVNRATFAFNDGVDRAVLRPVAQAYVRVVPRTVRTGVNNFLTNLAYPTTIANNLLQLKLLAALSDTARFTLNSTLGLAGLLDPATAAGLARNDEDFGQTLGWWGVRPGPYLVLPLMGPSTLRDTVGRGGDYYTDLRSHLDADNAVDFAYLGISIVNARARLLSTERLIDGVYDRYGLVRDAYLQRREYQVRDGQLADEPFEDDLLDDLDDLDEEVPAELPAAEPPPE